jgi:hypothetical protein
MGSSFATIGITGERGIFRLLSPCRETDDLHRASWINRAWALSFLLVRGGVGFLFSHRWIVEFKPPVAGAVPMVKTSTRDKVCSLFAAILARSKGGLILPSKDKSTASPLASPNDIPADETFYVYFVPLQHNKTIKGIICFKSEVNFSTLRKELWQFLTVSICQGQIHIEKESSLSSRG